MKKLILFLIILLGITGCFGKNEGAVKDVSMDDSFENVSKIPASDIVNGFYRGGCLIYSEEKPDLNMLAAGKYFTVKLGKFTIKEAIVTDAALFVDKRADTTTNPDLVRDSDLNTEEQELVVDSENYYSIAVNNISKDKVTYSIFKWNGSSFDKGEKIELSENQEYDIDKDGNNDIRWSSGSADRGLGNSKYLTFLSSYDKRYSTMYQMKDEWSPKGYLPYGIVSVSNDGNVVMNERAMNGSQKIIIDTVVQMIKEGKTDITKIDPFVLLNLATTTNWNVDEIKSSIDTFLTFMQTSDYIYTMGDEIKKITKSGSITRVGSQTISIENLTAKEYQEVLEQGIFDSYDYTAEYIVDSKGNVYDKNKTKKSQKRETQITVSERHQIDLIVKEKVIGNIGLESGATFTVKVNFKKWWIGASADVSLITNPYFVANASLFQNNMSAGEDKTEVALSSIKIFSGATIPLGSFPGRAVLGETYLTPIFYVDGAFDLSLKYEYNKAFETKFSFKAGKNKQKKWYGSAQYLGTKKISETNQVQFPTIPSSVGGFGFTPQISTALNFEMAGVFKPYVSYTIANNNNVKLANSTAIFNSSIEGYATSGIDFGMTKTCNVFGRKLTIDVSRKFSLGEIPKTRFAPIYIVKDKVYK